jgi:hypothetical protein
VTISLTRREPARLILIFRGIAGPVIAGLALPKVVLPMCSSFEFERSVSNEMSETLIGK